MSLVVTAGVALAYATGVVGVHRYTVGLRRARAQGYPSLQWLDWDTLLAGVLPANVTTGEASVAAAPLEGGPTPALLLRAGASPGVALVRGLVTGHPVPRQAFAEAGFSGGEARWLGLLADLRGSPGRVLDELLGTPAATPAEAYLREHLALTHGVTPFTLELATFAAKRRINQSFARFGQHPALYFVRARASGLLGFTGAVLDDLARAVYFSKQAHFYLAAVAQMPFIEEARPALRRACVQALERQAP